MVFFREKKMMGAMISYKVRENGVELCKLSNGTFCTVQAPVGKHEYVTQTEAKDVLTLEVESGETYYLAGQHLDGHDGRSRKPGALEQGSTSKA